MGTLARCCDVATEPATSDATPSGVKKMTTLIIAMNVSRHASSSWITACLCGETESMWPKPIPNVMMPSSLLWYSALRMAAARAEEGGGWEAGSFTARRHAVLRVPAPRPLLQVRAAVGAH
eukprot:6350514-Prymnesium_polylepis.1